MAIALLGPLIVDGEKPLEPRDRVALSLLAVHLGAVVSPDRFAEAIWGDDPPSSWPKQVQICIGRLRKVLGAVAIQTVPGGYRLVVSEESIDSHRFERLLDRARTLAAGGESDRAVVMFTRALALWRGLPLADLDRWPPARIEMARLAELRLAAEEDLLQARLAAGDHRAVAAEAQALVTADPLRERRWALLALSQYRSGRQGDALRSLRMARDVLAERLGVDPGPELTALEASILRQDPGLESVPEAVPSGAGDCPYRGLVPFDVDDDESFFGRTADIAACLTRIASAPVLVLAGPSGCGKSSLARAGLVPALRAQGRPCAVMSPGDDPAAAMTESLAAVEGPAVLVVDQFENVFTLGLDAEAVRTFCRRLAGHAHEQGPVIITVRSDHLGDMGVDPVLSRLVEQGLYLMRTLGGDELREAIVRPAEIAGLRLEDGLVDLLLRDADGAPGALPMLSHSLVETWRRREGHVLTVEGYRASGGIRGAVARSAERLHDNLPAGEQAVLRTVLLRLVSATDTGEPVRCRVSARSLLGDPRRERVVALLVRSRLVTADEHTVEIAHEALIRAWPRLRAWLDEDVAGQQILRHLSATADGWESLGRPGSELVRGARLQTTLDWRSAAAPDLTATEIAYLDASVARTQAEAQEIADRGVRDARQNRRLRGLLAAAAAFLALSLVAGLVAWGSRQDIGRERDAALAAQQDARIEALVNRSLALRSTGRGVAALLAVEAYRRRPDARSLSALLGTFTAAPTFLGRRYLVGDSITGVLIPGTGSAVVAVDGGPPVVLDLANGEREERFAPGPAGPSLLAVSADGRVTARATWTGRGGSCARPPSCAALALFDTGTGRPLGGPVAVPFPPSTVALDADGSLVAVAGGNAEAAWYRTGDGRQVGALPGLPTAVSDLPEHGDFRFDGGYDTAAVTFGPTGTLYIGSRSGPLRAVDPVTSTVTGEVDLPALSSESHLMTTPEGVLVAGGRNGIAAVDTASMRPLWSIDTRGDAHPENCPWLTVAPLTSRLYCGGYYGVIHERDLASGLPTGVLLDPQNGSVGRLAVSSDGRELVAFGAEDPVISRWRLDGSGPITRLVAPGHVVADGYDVSGFSLLVAARPRGSTTSDDFQEFGLWDPVSERTTTVSEDVEGLGWAGRNTLFGFSRTREQLEYYDSATGATLRGDPVPPDAERAWPSGEGRRLYAGFSSGDVWTIDVPTRRRTAATIKAAGSPLSVSATRDGARVVVTAFGAAGLVTTVHDGPSGRELDRGLDGVTLTGVSADGVLVGATEGRIARYDLATLAPVATFPGARGEINSLQFSRDGAILLATSNDQTVSLYDVASGTRLGDPIPTAAPFIVPGFLHPDGRTVAVTAREGVALWDVDPAHLLQAACRTAGRNLTRGEWATYLEHLGDYRTTC